MDLIAPFSIGLITQILNFIEIWLLIEKSQRKTPFEIILLSLAFADFLAGTGTLLLGSVHLLYLLPSIAKSDMLHILYITASIVIGLGLAASFVHVFLITIERFGAVYFPIHHVFLFLGEETLKSQLQSCGFTQLSGKLSTFSNPRYT